MWEKSCRHFLEGVTRMISGGYPLGEEDYCFKQVLEYLRTHRPEPVEPGFKFFGESI